MNGYQSMSKKWDDGASGPFARTSRHHGFVAVLMPMWFGTKFTTCCMPASRTASVKAVCASAPPTSELMTLWLVTS